MITFFEVTPINALSEENQHRVPSPHLKYNINAQKCIIDMLNVLLRGILTQDLNPHEFQQRVSVIAHAYGSANQQDVIVLINKEIYWFILTYYIEYSSASHVLFHHLIKLRSIKSCH